jgi:hypothetical protein
VNLVSPKPVSRAELADLRLHLTLECLKPGELVHAPGHLLEVTDDECAYRCVALCGRDSRIAVNVIGN